jgi:hypothetical protein
MGSLETLTEHVHSIYLIAYNRVRKISASSVRNQLQKWTLKENVRYAIQQMDGPRYMMSIASAIILSFQIKSTNAFSATAYFLIVKNASSLINNLHFKKT